LELAITQRTVTFSIPIADKIDAVRVILPRLQRGCYLEELGAAPALGPGGRKRRREGQQWDFRPSSNGIVHKGTSMNATPKDRLGFHARYSPSIKGNVFVSPFTRRITTTNDHHGGGGSSQSTVIMHHGQGFPFLFACVRSGKSEARAQGAL
jgi:hypothetical protein